MIAPRVFAALLCLAIPAAASAQNRLTFDRQVEAVFAASDNRLKDGSFFQEWIVTATAGTRVTITMRSTKFDSFLDLGRYKADGAWESLQTNDDGGGGRDAQLTYDIPSSGEYFVRTVTYNSNQTGEYTLLLTQPQR